MRSLKNLLLVLVLLLTMSPRATGQLAATDPNGPANVGDDLFASVDRNELSAAAMGFEENKGQVLTTEGVPAAYVRYRLSEGNTHIFLLRNGIAYQFNRMHYPDGYDELMANAATDPGSFEKLASMRSNARSETYRMDMLLEGVDLNARVTAEGRSSDHANYFNYEALDVRSYTKVTYHDVYPGIDWVVYTTAKGMKYDFVVHPGADPALIRLRFKDHEELRVDASGSLIHGNSMGKFTEQKPVSFQDGKEVPTSFVLDGEVLHFSLEAYDRNSLLIIDPARVWGTYYGGGDTDYGFNTITDGDGNVYLVGASLSNTAIASGGHQNTIGGLGDAMLIKFDENGTRLWSTYYGGTGDEQGVACAIDATGNAYLIGSTGSATGISSGGHQNTFGGGSFDGFLVKFDPNGNRIWGTYYGGTGYDVGYSCAVDPSGSLFIAGYTTSTSSIASAGHQNVNGGGGLYDAFLVKFNSAGTRTWGTYYGGSADDYAFSCVPDADGNVFLAGYTGSTTAISSGGHQNVKSGGTDAFLAKFATGGARIWGTYYGGAQNEVGYSGTVDADGNPYLVGYTSSTTTTAIATGGHQNTFGGNVDAFLVKFNPSGGRSWGTYYGGTGADFGRDCATDAEGNVYLIGYTPSTSAIASGGHQNTNGGGTNDAFLARFNPNGTRLWATYYGGSADEVGFACRVDAEGNVYAAGYTASSAAIALGGHQNTYGSGSYDAFLVKFRGGATQDCAGYWGGSAALDACGNCTGGTTGLEACDQYRSKQTGNWHLASTWERFDGTNWVNASAYPTIMNSDSISIRSPHVVTLTNAVGAIPMDDLVIQSGGTLTLSDGCHNFNDDPADPIDVRIFGTFNGNGACGSMGCCGAVSVESGGVINYNVDGSIFAPTTVQVGGTFNAPTATNALNAVTNYGTFTKTSGALTAQNFQNQGVLSINGGNLIINSIFTNSGTTTITNGDVRLNQVNATFTNSGTFNVNGTALGQFTNNAASGQSWNNNATGIININNTALKGIGCCVPFNNAGTFNVNAGQLNQFTTFNHTGAISIGSGAVLQHAVSGPNSGTYSIASGGSMTGGMNPFTGPTFTNNGTVSITSLQFAGTASQTLAGSGSISTLNVNNANGVVQTGTQTISTALLLSNGKITTGAGDLILGPSASLTGGGAASYVATTGVGKLVRRVPVNILTLFPVGTAASYLPVRMTLAPGSTADDYRVRAQADLSSSYDGFGIASGSNVTDRVVARSWFISEAVGSGTNATIQFDWNIAEEGAAFDRSNSRVSLYNGGVWDLGPLASASGSGPYARSRAGLTSLGTFTVSDAATFFGPDLCPGDANKTDPGQCGCGNLDTDSDADGTANCNDGCPNDPLKIALGQCGCGIADTDADGDGTANCNDGCPNDPLKIALGQCGCGVADTDADGDGTANCNDACPNDPLKIALGQCGCGIADTDTDGDGTANCSDGCPNDPLKITAGICGCGVADTDGDGDGTANCFDGCPLDPNKIAAGACGCGIPDTDTDSDGIPNCNDNCPNVTGQLGSPCNDGNALTTGETLQAGCVCGGGVDCNGTVNGTAYLDNCSTCVGGTTGLSPCVPDCNGVYGGTAAIDQCGTCAGGNTGIVPNSGCLDCAGVPNGLHELDTCGSCLLPSDPNFSTAVHSLSFSGGVGFTASLLDPQVGSPAGTYIAEVIYTNSEGGTLPIGYPRAILDFEGNGVFTNPLDRTVLMTAVDPADNNTANGKLYRATVVGLAAGTNWQMRIVTQSGACNALIGPFNYPDVLTVPDVAIYANDITFSDATPPVNSPIAVHAVVRNLSNQPAQNFTAHLVNQFDPGAIYPDIAIGFIAPNSTTTVQWNITTPLVPAWCPMQVFVDADDDITESNELNNSAIRPFTNGDFDVPGGILLTAGANPPDAYQGTTQFVYIQGTATYTGTAVPLPDPSVAGATITVHVIGGGTFTGLTNSAGQYSVAVPADGPLGETNLEVYITDYTLSAETTTSYTQHPPLVCLPDLEVTVNVAPSSIVAGQSVSGSFVVRNTGCGPMPFSTLLDVTQTGGTVIPDVTVPALAPGAQFTSNFSGIVFPAVGSYVICATADGNFAVAEESEDNTRCAGVYVGSNGADLSPSGVAFGSGLVCSATLPVITVNNSGALGTAGFNVQVKVSRNGVLQQTFNQAIGPLAGASAATFSVNYTYPGDGVYAFEVTCDVAGVITETNEANNIITSTHYMEACIPELVIAHCNGLNVGPVDPAFPGAVTYGATVRNVGSATAMGPISVQFNVSGGGTYTGQIPGNLAPNAQAIATVSAPSVAPATATLTAEVDPNDLITEYNETDNSLVGDLCWDFKPDSLCMEGSNFWEYDYVVNQTAVIRIGLRSLGLYKAAQVPVRFEVTGPGIVGTALLGDVIVNNMNPTCDCPVFLALPNTFLFSALGTYTFTMTADPLGVFTECDEANNTWTRSVEVTNLPDLRVLSEYIGPSLLNPDIGEAITLDMTYDNAGASNLGDVFNVQVEIDNIPFATVPGQPGLLGGDDNTVAIPGTFSSNVVGVHIIRAIVDGGGAVAESNEANNEATRSFVAGPAANLYFASFAPSVGSPAVGETIQIQASIANAGDSPVNAELQCFYVTSEQDTLPIGTSTFAAAAQGSTPVQMAWTVTEIPVEILGRIVNATGLEFNYNDNSAHFIIGAFDIALASVPGCTGGANGSLTATASNGTAPYAYTWSNGASGPVLNAQPGAYTVSVVDGDGYLSSANGTIGLDPTDTDSDGTTDCTDGCPDDPLKTAAGICGCGTPETDSDADGTPNCTDGCPNDPDKIAPGICNCGTADIDTDGDSTLDCLDGCPNDPLKTAAGVCGCGIADTDNDGDGILNCNDNCPNVPGLIGSACDADPGTGVIAGLLNNACTCVATCTENLTVELRTDALSSQASWQILAQNSNTVLCSFSVPVDGITAPITAECCLPMGCYRLRVLDSGGDGFVSGGTTGGYQVRESGSNGRRIIDNFGNFSSSATSTLAGTYDNGSFCVPLGNDRPIFSSCDKQDWVNFQFIVATENVAVSAVYTPTPINSPANSTSGYEFWFYDPNGSYSYRRFRNHATSDGFGTGATRACHFKINGWINSMATPHIPANILLNVRIRGRVNGVNLPFGPACLFKIDNTLAACPRVKLQDNPFNTADFSCGVTRTFGGANSASNRIVANPPQFTPAVSSASVRYQFRFRIPGEIPSPGSCIVRPPQTSPTLALNWTTGDKLKCNTLYEVDVRVSKDGGATWCIDGASPACSGMGYTPWGKICTVNITTSTFCPASLQGGSSSLALETNGSFTMYPNPNRGDQLFLSVSEVEPDVNTVTVDLFDMTGKRVMARTIAVTDNMVNTHLDLDGSLAGGLYLVNITAGARTYSERLIIAH